MILIFYATDSDNKVVNKNLHELFRVENATWKNATSLLNPEFEIMYMSNRDFVSANIVYIPDFQRYYYIDSVVAGLGSTMTISLSVDVLLSHADEIRGITTLIDRQENVFNNYIVDNQLRVRADRFIDKINVGTVPHANGANIVLTVTNGGSEE